MPGGSVSTHVSVSTLGPRSTGFFQSCTLNGLPAGCGICCECVHVRKSTGNPGRSGGFGHLLDLLFVYLTRNAVRTADFFQIPPSRVVELGAQVAF